MSLEDDLLKKSNRFEVLDNIAFSTGTVSKELSREFLLSLDESIAKAKSHKKSRKEKKERRHDYESTKEELPKLESEKTKIEDEMKIYIIRKEMSLSNNDYALAELQNKVIESSKDSIVAYEEAIESYKKHICTLEESEIVFDKYENNMNIALRELKDIRKSVKIYSKFNFTIEHYKELIGRYDSEIARYNEFIRKGYRHPTPDDDTCL